MHIAGELLSSKLQWYSFGWFSAHSYQAIQTSILEAKMTYQLCIVLKFKYFFRFSISRGLSLMVIKRLSWYDAYRILKSQNFLCLQQESAHEPSDRFQNTPTVVYPIGYC